MATLLDSPKLADVMVPVRSEPVERLEDVGGGEVERRKINFRAIVDQDERGCDRTLTVRSDDYALLQNSEVFGALVLAMDNAGVELNLDPRRADYHRGKTRVEFTVPGHQITLPGDTSPSEPTVILYNDYTGGGKLQFRVGVYRLVCSNGLIIGHDIATVSRKHVGKAKSDVMTFFNKAMLNFKSSLTASKLTVEMAAAKRVEDEAIEKLVTDIENDITEKYRSALRSSMSSNVAGLGSNAWGVVQGVSEFFSHDVPNTHANSQKRDKWTERVMSLTGVKKAVGEALSLVGGGDGA